MVNILNLNDLGTTLPPFPVVCSFAPEFAKSKDRRLLMKRTFIFLVILVSVLSLNCFSNLISVGNTMPGTDSGSGGSSAQPPPQPESVGDTKPGTGPGSGSFSTQPLPQPTLLSIDSVPSGASVEIGLKSINNIVTPGTGRNVGVTPVTVELRKSDLDSYGNVIGILKLQGYADRFFFLTRLEPGKKYNVSLRLTKIPPVAFPSRYRSRL